MFFLLLFWDFDVSFTASGVFYSSRRIISLVLRLHISVVVPFSSFIFLLSERIRFFRAVAVQLSYLFSYKKLLADIEGLSRNVEAPLSRVFFLSLAHIFLEAKERRFLPLT